MISQIVAKHVEPRALDELISYTRVAEVSAMPRLHVVTNHQNVYEIGMTMPLFTIEALRKTRQP